MDRLLNALKAQSFALTRSQGQPRFGLVSSVDPSRYAVRVLLQPEDVMTGWLPVLAIWTGSGWGITCLPLPGDQVLVLPQEGDGEHGVVAAACYSDSNRPPASSPGEFQILHKSGASFRLGADGVVYVEGDLRVNGDIYDRVGSLDRLRRNYNRHVHGSIGAPPTPLD